MAKGPILSKKGIIKLGIYLLNKYERKLAIYNKRNKCNKCL